MAMDLDNIKVQFNNINKRLDSISRSFNNNQYRPRFQNNNGYPQHPPRLTDNEREHLDQIGGCYRCRQPGHMGPNCPIYGNSTRNSNNGQSYNNRNNNRNNNNNRAQGGRWVYQVTVGDAPESGKASGDQD
ncbi:hypothetical protein FBU30_002071 [Linnemannia zychae]|nr:hypothetical protein FBU30_002071 [Linnemannia zychae]